MMLSVSVDGLCIMRRDIFRVNESFQLQWPLKLMEVTAHAFVIVSALVVVVSAVDGTWRNVRREIWQGDWLVKT